MSTILRSLKRLETESAADKGKTALSTFAARQAMHRSVRFAWLKSRFIQWGLLAVLLIAGGLVLYAYIRPATKPFRRSPQAALAHPVARRRPPAGQAARSAIPRPPPQPLSSTARPRAQMVARTKTIQNGAAPLEPMGPSDVLARKPGPSAVDRLSGPPVTVPPRSPSQKAAGRTAASSRAGRSSASVSSVQPVTGRTATQPIAGRIPSQKIPPAAEPANRANAHQPNAASARPKKPFANAERMTDGRLKVQAIVWAPRAEDRMAVINNRIVREGKMIDGFSVVEIGENAVYVREGGRLLKVLFGQP